MHLSNILLEECWKLLIEPNDVDNIMSVEHNLRCQQLVKNERQVIRQFQTMMFYQLYCLFVSTVVYVLSGQDEWFNILWLHIYSIQQST